MLVLSACVDESGGDTIIGGGPVSTATQPPASTNTTPPEDTSGTETELSGETTTPEGYKITWTIRQEEGVLRVSYRAEDPNGNPVEGTAFATVAKGDPGGDPDGGHDNGPFVDGVAELSPPINHPPGTVVGFWVFFEGLDQAINLTNFTVAP
jgi:hypothetical protein